MALHSLRCAERPRNQPSKYLHYCHEQVEAPSCHPPLPLRSTAQDRSKPSCGAHAAPPPFPCQAVAPAPTAAPAPPPSSTGISVDRTAPSPASVGTAGKVPGATPSSAPTGGGPKGGGGGGAVCGGHACWPGAGAPAPGGMRYAGEALNTPTGGGADWGAWVAAAGCEILFVGFLGRSHAAASACSDASWLAADSACSASLTNASHAASPLPASAAPFMFFMIVCMRCTLARAASAVCGLACDTHVELLELLLLELHRRRLLDHHVLG